MNNVIFVQLDKKNSPFACARTGVHRARRLEHDAELRFVAQWDDDPPVVTVTSNSIDPVAPNCLDVKP